MRPDQTLGWMHDGTSGSVRVAGLPDEAMGGPTALPGWTRGYLFRTSPPTPTRCATWCTGRGPARSAGCTPLPRSATRTSPPAGAARRRAAGLGGVVRGGARRRPRRAGRSDAWDAKVITAQGLTRSASEIPWMRAREVYIHAIDLAAGTTFADLPEGFLTALLDDVTGRRSAMGGGPALALGRHRHRPAGTWRARAPRCRSRPARRPGRLPDRPPRPVPAGRPGPPRLALTKRGRNPKPHLERTVASLHPAHCLDRANSHHRVSLRAPRDRNRQRARLGVTTQMHPMRPESPQASIRVD